MKNLMTLLWIGLMVYSIMINDANGFDCGESSSTSITPPNDGNFSDGSCIVKADYTAINCALDPPDYGVVNDSIPLPCPGGEGAQANSTGVIEGGQIVYATMEDALANCPYGLIEFTGTIYMSTAVSKRQLWYNSSKSLTIRGIDNVVTDGGQDIVELVPTTVIVYNETTGLNQTEIQLVPTVTGQTPVVTVTLSSALVGFKNLQTVYKNISITLETLLFDGCGAEDGIFLTKAPCPTCGTLTTNYCEGAWFPLSANVTYNGYCMQSAALFNGTQHVSFQNGTGTTGDFYNNFLPTDFRYFQITNQFTLEAWINPSTNTQATRAYIAGNFRWSDTSSVRTGFGFEYAPASQGGGVRFIVGSRSRNAVWCQRNISPTVWTHLAGTFQDGLLSMYVNGNLVCNITATFTSILYRDSNDINGNDGTRPFTIGGGWTDKGGNGSDRNDHFFGFIGAIDEVRLWNVVRTSAQIASSFQKPVSIISTNLLIYMRFDSTGFQANLAFGVSGQPIPRFYVDIPSGGDILAIADCFCTSVTASCTPTLTYPLAPANAVTEILTTDSITNYEFIPGMTIQPNGVYGSIWLPGMTSTSGPIFNQTVRFVPGIWRNETDIYGNVTRTFIPGVLPTLFSPRYSATENPYIAYNFFLPGWFLNDGKAPFIPSNFFPGIFLDINSSSVPVPDDWETGDLIFNPGLQFPNGFFVPYLPLDPLYLTPIVIHGGISFNATLDLDNCTTPPLPVVNASTTTIPVIESLLGCNVSATDPEPLYLNPLDRDPCFALRDIRALLPPGTEALNPEEILGCIIGPNDPEPTFLNPKERDPCFVLRDIRALIPIPFKCDDGTDPLPEVWMPCLTNQNLTLDQVIIQNYYGEKVICQWACDENVNLIVQNSTFQGIPGNAIWSTGLQNMDIHENAFCPCGGITDSCVYINGNYVTPGEFYFYNNRHCAIEDLWPISCSYDITPELRCEQSEVQCLDVYATLVEGCQQVEVSPGVFLFDSDCAVFGPCECAEEQQVVELPDGSTTNITTQTGDVILNTAFFTPSLIAYGSPDGTTFVLTCNTELQSQTITYECKITVNITVEIAGINVTFEEEVDSNCTTTAVIKVATGNQSISCPCPNGYNVSSDTHLVGNDAAEALGLYQTCQWDIPGGLPGEQCLDGIVQCPYLGGSLGSGAPPPVPVGECDGGTAVVPCSSCVGGFINFEGYIHPCPSSCTAVNTTVTVFTVPCYCLDFSLTVPCSRNVTCIPTTSCVNNTLCAILGTLTWDGHTYQCSVPANETLCTGISYAPSHPTPPADGYMTVPCSTTYETPSPGDCSCIPTISNNNLTIACTGANCTSGDFGSVYGDPSLQLICQPSGYISCRCDGVNAIDPFSNTNFTRYPGSAAYKFGYIHPSSVWFQQNNVAQQSEVGIHFSGQFSRDLIVNNPLKVLWFLTGHTICAETMRLSPFLTGTRFDCVQGAYQDWNIRNCSYVYPITPTNECRQLRPQQKDSCVVDQTYDPIQTDGFGVTRFSSIQEAHDKCPVDAIIVHASQGVYEEQLQMTRNNIILISYDNAIIATQGSVWQGDNNTIRGFVFMHLGTGHQPIIQPGNTDNNFYLNYLFDPSKIKNPPNFIKIYNNRFLGQNVKDAGALVGYFGKSADIQFNTFESFYIRTVLLNTPDLTFNLNTFINCPGRAVAFQQVKSYDITENVFIDCVGMNVANLMETMLVRAYGDIGKLFKSTIGDLIFGNFSVAEYNAAFDTQAALDALSPDIGCNTTFDSSRVCRFKGNRHIVSDTTNRPQFSSVCFSIVGGAIQPENITDNTCNFARIGIAFSFTPLITYNNRAQITKQNFLIQPHLTTDPSIKNGADQVYRRVGELSSIGCNFPDCLATESLPPVEANPQCDLIITKNYGYSCMNNISAAIQYTKPLNLINVTSNKNILRRDNLLIERSAYMVGLNDPFCCQSPIVYGNTHTFGSSVAVIQNIEFRYELDPNDDDPSGDQFLQTPASFLADQIRLLDVYLNGRMQVGQGLLEVASLHLDPTAGVFEMQGSTIDNWWHFPDDTVKGTADTARGTTKVVVLPTDNIIYYEDQIPNVQGISVYFQSYERLINSRYARKSSRNQAPLPESMCILLNNTIRNIDGRAIFISTPGNWEIRNNTILDSGMRHPKAKELILLEGNTDSVGDYFFDYNVVNQTRVPLWFTAGGNTNPVDISALTMTGLLFPSRFTVLLNTVCNNGPYDYGTEPVVVPKEETPEGDYGWFKKDGPKIFGSAIKWAKKKPDPYTKTADQLFDRNTDINQLTGSDGTVSDGVAFNDIAGNRLYLEDEDTLHTLRNVITYGVFTVAGRFNLPPDVLFRTQTRFDPYNVDMYFLEVDQGPLRVIAEENYKDTGRMYAAKGLPIPTNSPLGFEGLKNDLVSGTGFKDTLDESFSQVTICNDGCPMRVPPACLVDPNNATFVPENPYYNAWFFITLSDALKYCVNPKKEIWLYRQPTPFTEHWEINEPGWTIVSKGQNKTQVLISIPVILAADNTTINGFEFIHNVGDNAPTLVTQSDAPLQFISLINITFTGQMTVRSAIFGNFASLAMAHNDFSEYDEADRVVWIESNCGNLVFQNNTFFNVWKTSVWASNFNRLDAFRSHFFNCGGGSPMVAYFSICKQTASKVTFTRNKQQTSDYEPGSYQSKVAAFWLDGVPLLNSTSKTLNLESNTAKGLDIGLRVTNTDDLGGSRRTMIEITLYQANVDCEGDFHHVVWGEPADDFRIENDPLGTIKYWCDNDCKGSDGLVAGLAVLWFVIVIVVSCLCIHLVICMPNRIDEQMGWSYTLNRYVSPSNPNLRYKTYRYGDNPDQPIIDKRYPAAPEDRY